MELLGFNFDAIGALWIFIALAVIIAIIGVFVFFYFNSLHPKKTFKIFARNGVFTRTYRIYYAKVPTEFSIWDILLGKRPVGFPINWFKQEFFETPHIPILAPTKMMKVYVGQYIDGRLFPLPMADMLGIATFIHQRCPNPDCKASSRFWDATIKKCPMCDIELVFETTVITNEVLQGIKYNPEVEQRAIYKLELNQSKYIPLHEWIAMYDVGAKIAEAMATSDEDTQKILSNNNPFLTVILAVLPMAILMIGFGFAAYVMWMGMGQSTTEASNTLKLTSESARITAEMVYNTTKILNATGVIG